MFDLFPAYLTPIVIFFARIIDVSLGTIRILMVSRGQKALAAFLGFFEVLVWAIVVTELIKNLDNWINFVAYAGGFAAGTFIGIYIEEILKVGTIIVRIITRDRFRELSNALKEAKFTITSLDGSGGYVPVKVIFTVLKRKRWKEIVAIIETYDPEAFYSVEEVKYASAKKKLQKAGNEKRLVYRLLRLRKGI